ncbi:MAG: hypothetical protein KDD95_12100, partial [Rhodobacteraceae bacterium]|nr:hypothetical protein [Paracoccaceae bacterium]
MTRPDPGSDRPVGPRAFTCPPLPSKQGKTPALAAWAASGGHNGRTGKGHAHSHHQRRRHQ